MPIYQGAQIEVVAQACIEANELIQAGGTEVMRTLMRVLLLEIGQEIARQQIAAQDDANGE